LNAPAVIPQVLPHIGAALVIASIVLTLSRRWIKRKEILSGLFAGSFFISLLPLSEFSITHFARVLTGDVSVAGMIWLATINLAVLLSPELETRSPADRQVAVALAVIALVLYPTALGFSPFDLYSLGYSPVTLSIAVATVFAACVWREKWLPALMLAAAYVAWLSHCLDSDNLWDYLLDPVIVIYALSILLMDRRRKRPPSALDSL
jgi:hypothetical protein